MLFLSILCVVLIIIIIILTFKLAIIRKSMREICTEFEEILSSDTNVLISVSSADKTVKRLANEINKELRELRKMELKYNQGDRELKEAVTNISHDLRTPLTAICGYLDLLEKQELPADAERYLEQIHERTENLKQLTAELFRYSVIASAPEMSLEKINICLVLEESLISFEGAMKQAGITPEITMPENPVYRLLDKASLSRIFGNIINNAIKYSDGDFTVTLDENGTITFSNKSKELSAVETGKLFDRFYTVNSARKSTGLGLSIAKLLTERMNGNIFADYRDEQLIITVKFPNAPLSNQIL